MHFHLPKSLAPKGLPKTSDRPRPTRDWMLLLSLAALILVASAGWNVWTFVRVTSGDVGAVEEAAVDGPDLTALERVRAAFQERAAEEARYRSDYRFVDPSK